MIAATKKMLLSNSQVVEEIKRHLWIESEKSGYDIGFDAAAEDWLSKYAKNWMEEYMPKTKLAKDGNKNEAKLKKAPTRKRAAKTYL